MERMNSMYSYTREKAYRAKRASQAAEEMEQAIQTKDTARFLKAWDVAMKYMPVKVRSTYYRRMLAMESARRREAKA